MDYRECCQNIADICKNYGYMACPKCPLFSACVAENDPSKTDAENTEDWEARMAAAYQEYAEKMK